MAAFRLVYGHASKAAKFSRPTERDALMNTMSSGLSSPGSMAWSAWGVCADSMTGRCRAGLRGASEVVGVAVSYGDEQLDAQFGDEFADGVVGGLGVWAEFAHLAEDRDRAPVSGVGGE